MHILSTSIEHFVKKYEEWILECIGIDVGRLQMGEKEWDRDIREIVLKNIS